MMYVRFPLSLRQVEHLLSERCIDICHETVRLWWNRFGRLFAAEIRKRRVHRHWYPYWRWHLDEVFVRINGKTYYLSCASERALQKFTSIHASVHNHFNHQRHLNHSDIFLTKTGTPPWPNGVNSQPEGLRW